MDPKANLEEQRRIIAKLKKEWRSGMGYNDPEDVSRLIELSEALDQWLTRGGFLPVAWQRPIDVVGKKL